MIRKLFLVAILSSIAGLEQRQAFANNDTWKLAADGNWEVGIKWTDGTTPTTTDSATIGDSGTYTITFGVAPSAIQQLTVNNGANVTFQSGGTTQTLSVNSNSGNQTINLADSGTFLTLGTSGNPLNLIAGSSLSVQAGTQLQALFGSQLSATDLSSCRPERHYHHRRQRLEINSQQHLDRKLRRPRRWHRHAHLSKQLHWQQHCRVIRNRRRCQRQFRRHGKHHRRLRGHLDRQFTVGHTKYSQSRCNAFTHRHRLQLDAIRNIFNHRRVGNWRRHLNWNRPWIKRCSANHRHRNAHH